MRKQDISAAILAGGAAIRLGGATKSNLIVDGRTVISRIMEAISSIFDEIIIVTNDPAEFSLYNDKIIVPDIFKGVGPLGGIHAALEASSSAAIFVIAGDMPLISREIIIDQISFFRKSQPEVLIPRIGDYLEPLHSIYKRSILTRIEGYIRNDNDKAVWNFINSTLVEYFEPDDEIEAVNSFRSINSPSDADIIEKIIRNRFL